MSTRRPILWLTLMSMAAAGCAPPPAEEEAIIRPVRFTRVAALGGSEQRAFSGVAQAAVETDLSFKVAGLLAQRPVKVGDTVQRGDLLASLDPEDYRVRAQEAQAGLARSEAELRNAESRYQRTRNLYENRNASRSELDSARAAAESAAAAVRAAGQQLQAARLQLSYTRLTAPLDCSVAATYVKENENVAAGQPVVQLNCGDCAEIQVAVPETVITRIETGGPVAVHVDALPDLDLNAVVTEVGIASNGTTYPVTVRLEGDCPGIRSGMAADVTFSLPRPAGEGRIAVPPVAVGEDARGRFVYVLEEQSPELRTARRRDVTTGPIGPEGIVIDRGLVEGELIATAGVRLITDGQTVRLQNGTSF